MKRPVEVGQRHPDRRRLEGGAEALLGGGDALDALAQRGLGGDALADVAHDRLPLDRRAGRRRRARAARAPRSTRSGPRGGAGGSVTVIVPPSSVDARARARRPRGGRRGGRSRAAGARRSPPARGRSARSHAGETYVIAAVGAEREDRVGRVVGEQPVALLGRAQLGLGAVALGRAARRRAASRARSRWSACRARIPSATVSSMPATGTPQWSTASIVATSVAIAARTVRTARGTPRRRSVHQAPSGAGRSRSRSQRHAVPIGRARARL